MPQVTEHGEIAVRGSLLDVSSSSFTQLERWLDNGASENNAPPAPQKHEQFACSTSLGVDEAFDPNADPASADYGRFVSEVNPILGKSCAAANCHGSPVNTLQLTCGTTPEQTRWNYFAASDYVSPDPAASELLRRTLDPSQGGTYHEGGAIFASTADPGYRAVLGWVTEKGGPDHVPEQAGFDFFAKRVQPMLVKRGCMMLGCHSAPMFHDYRLRGGSGGHFGLPATRRNYELSLEQVALESPDPNASRLIKKNLPPAPQGDGILHRGGALFASGGDPAACDLDAAANGPLNEQSPYCVLLAWLEVERGERMAGAMPLSAIVYVRRPAAAGKHTPQDWASYAPGAELLRVEASYDAAGEVVLGAESSLSGLCGLDVATSDVRRPTVSWDGSRVAFAARSGETEPYAIYVVDNGGCAVEPTIAAAAVDDQGNPVPTNGELVHNFDPAFAPDGRLVFASTRGNVMNTQAFSYEGPQRTPADPAKLNANLYVLENGKIRQLTFLLNQEILPNFMSDGRLIMVTEKREPGFYQLSGRRQNLDGGDYHPLFGQRGTIGFDQFHDVVELSDKNLAAIASQRGAAHGAGALVVVNRSIGIDQRSDDPADYVHDPSAMGALNPKFYQHSMHFPDPAATGRLDETQGAYATPSALPDGRILVSYAANVVNLGDFRGNFDVFVVDAESGRRTPLISAAEDLLWPVAVYARQNHGVFTSRIDEVNGASHIYTSPERRGASDITFVDVPLIASLLFQNTRTGRPLPPANPTLHVWEAMPPEPGVTSFGGAFTTTDQYGEVIARRRLIGSVAPYGDGSARVRIPGGMPIVLATHVQLAGDNQPSLHFQREQMQFYPGEWIHQSFPRGLFNGLCGGCHGSVSGLESHVAVNPDILTAASNVQARDAESVDVSGPPRGVAEGPPFP